MLTSFTQTEKSHILQTASIILLSKGAFNLNFNLIKEAEFVNQAT